jgi:YHS domain-containing protein
MLTSFLALALIAGPTTNCPIMGSPGKPAVGQTDYKGIRVSYSCARCQDKFEAEPDKHILAANKKKSTWGYSLFDPVSRRVLDTKTEAKWSAVSGGVLYRFSSAANHKAFMDLPAKFTMTPTKESLHCSVMDVPLGKISAAASYSDYEGTRYYHCCDSCQKMFDDAPAKWAAKVKNKVAPAKAVAAPKAS